MTSGKKPLLLYAKQPMRNYRAPTPNKKSHWVQGLLYCGPIFRILNAIKPMYVQVFHGPKHELIFPDIFCHEEHSFTPSFFWVQNGIATMQVKLAYTCTATRAVNLISSSSVSFWDGSFPRLALVTPFVPSPDCWRANRPSSKWTCQNNDYLQLLIHWK